MRVRLRFSKLGKVRWTSHRDVARMWERAFRRVGLRPVYTQGFSPRPRISFGFALPTGAESVAEYLDVELDERDTATLDPATLPTLFSPALPVGVDVVAACAVSPIEGSLQEDVTSCSWTIEVTGARPDEVRDLVGAALGAPSLVVARERKGRTSEEDVRPAILSVDVAEPGAAAVALTCELATQPRGLRPAELVLALGGGLEAAHVRRTAQWIERDGARREPLPLDATAAPPASLLGRAS